MSKYSEFKKQLEENERLKNTAASDIGAVSFKEYERASGSDPLASFKANVSGIEASAALQKRATQNMLGTSGISGGYVAKSLGAIDKAKNAAINTAGAEALTESATNMNNYAGYVNKLATDKVNAANKNAETYNKTLYDITNKNMSKVEAENYIRLNNLGLDESQIQKLLKASDDNYKGYAANLENQAYLDTQLALTSITDRNKAQTYIAKQGNLSDEKRNALYKEWYGRYEKAELDKIFKNESGNTAKDVLNFYTNNGDIKAGDKEYPDAVTATFDTYIKRGGNVEELLNEYGVEIASKMMIAHNAPGGFKNYSDAINYLQSLADENEWSDDDIGLVIMAIFDKYPDFKQSINNNMKK
jgi:hypothetical protein